MQTICLLCLLFTTSVIIMSSTWQVLCIITGLGLTKDRLGGLASQRLPCTNNLDLLPYMYWSIQNSNVIPCGF